MSDDQNKNKTDFNDKFEKFFDQTVKTEYDQINAPQNKYSKFANTLKKIIKPLLFNFRILKIGLIIIAIILGILIFNKVVDRFPRLHAGFSFIKSIFSSEHIQKKEALLLNFRDINKLYTQMLFVVLEDCKTKEGKGCDNKSELLGICVRKYDVYFGYDNIENILLDPAMADLACSNQIDSLPKPKQLGINPLSTKTYGKYTLNDECYTWDKYPSKLDYHMGKALYNRQSNTNIYKQIDYLSKRQLKTLFEPICQVRRNQTNENKPQNDDNKQLENNKNQKDDNKLRDNMGQNKSNNRKANKK